MHRTVISIIFLIGGFVYSSWVSRLPRIQELYGLSNATLGKLLLVMAFGGLIAMPISGAVIVRYGSHTSTKFGAIGVCLLIPLIAIMPNIVFLYILLFSLGAVSGFKDVAMNAQAVVCETNLNKPIMSSFHALWSAGMILGASTGSMANRFEISIHYHLLLTGILCLLVVVWSIQHLIADLPEDKSEPLFSLPDKKVWLIGLIAFCAMMGEGAMADWSANYLEHVSGAAVVWSPLGLAVFSLAMTLGRIIGDRMRRMLGDPRLLLFCSVIALLGIGLVLATTLLSLALIGFFIAGVGLSIIVPIAYSIAGTLPNMASGKGISMVTTIGYSGFLFGPPIIGWLADLIDIRWALSVIGVMFLIMSLLSVRNYRLNDRGNNGQ